MQMNKHEQGQFLCDRIEAARPHIGFPIQTYLSEVFPDKPVMIVHRKHSVRGASNYPATTQLELLAVISVTEENKLYLFNHSEDATGTDFHMLSSPLIYPEQFTASA
jgi:hypothetical protein